MNADRNELSSWELTDFNLQERINLGGHLGLVSLMRSADGHLILVEDANHGLIPQDGPSPAVFAGSNSILGFVLDIGIRRERMLTHGSGFYFGEKAPPRQSARPITAKSYDETLFSTIATKINTHYQSGEKSKEIAAIRLQHLLDMYNNARLLFPLFFRESYLEMLSIVESRQRYGGAGGLATFAAAVSPPFSQHAYDAVKDVAGYAARLTLAEKVFADCLTKKWDCAADMQKLEAAGRFVFASFYCAYQYRNQFVHRGFPLPDTIKDAFGAEQGLGTAYLSPALGTSWHRIHRPDGLEPDDLIDIHDVLVFLGPEKLNSFKEEYFELLPTWYFMKNAAREVVLAEVKQLSG
jgi:hypothetical protein